MKNIISELFCFESEYLIEISVSKMSKRPIEDIYEESAAKKSKTYEHVKKHTLDSDEEDSDVDESR